MSIPDEASLQEVAKKAFRQYELAYQLSEADERLSLLASLAKTAFASELRDEAEKYASMMLNDKSKGWNRGNQIHHGNLILGRIALVEGDYADAKSRLLLAAKTPGSPQLDSFGPNMQLAKELLETGETQTVLEYFELCKRFWKMGSTPLKQWSADVKANRIPQFGANLNY